VTADKSDWRLQGQEAFLKGVTLVRRPYQIYAANPSWDHDHCAFCWVKFALDTMPDTLHEGHTTLNNYHWVCPACFEDFNEMFEWTVSQA
jgi:hypothetical protein